MSFKESLLKDWRAKAVASGLIAIISASFWVLSFTQGIAYLSYDLPFLFRAGGPTPEAVIVFMDEDSRSRLKQPVQGPWNRALHIKLLNELFARGARAVVFDVLFDEAWPDKAVDERFASVVKTNGHVVLAASIHYSGGAGTPVVGTFLRAAEPLGSAAPWGVAELPADNDGVPRQHYADERYVSLAWRSASVAGSAPSEENKPRWLNYYGPRGTISNVNYARFFEPDPVGLDVISNKVVFVGMAPIISYKGSKGSDEYPTPYSRWTGGDTTGVEIQATAFLNLSRRDWLSRLPGWFELILIATTALSFGFFLPLLRPGVALGLGATLGIVVTVLGLVLPLEFNKWFCWALIPAIEVPAGLVWLCLQLVGSGELRPKVQSPQVYRPQPKDHFNLREGTADVFISYASADASIADAACLALETKNIRCWIAPRDLLPGIEYGESIVNGIEHCRAMVLVFSSSANESPQVRREVERAVSKRKIIVPFRIELVLPARAMEYFVSTCHWLDAITPPIQAHIDHLAKTVDLLLSRMAPEGEHPSAQSEQAIGSLDPQTAIFQELEVTLSNTWDAFLTWLKSQIGDSQIESITEEMGTQKLPLYGNGKAGQLTYRLEISLKGTGVAQKRKIDVVHEWLHPLVLSLETTKTYLVWDTRLSPVGKDGNESGEIKHPLAMHCRDAVYSVRFAKPR